MLNNKCYQQKAADCMCLTLRGQWEQRKIENTQQSPPVAINKVDLFK